MVVYAGTQEVEGQIVIWELLHSKFSHPEICETLLQKRKVGQAVVAHAINPSTREAEAGRSL